MPLRPMPLVIHRAITKRRAFGPISLLSRPSTAAPRADQTRYEGRKAKPKPADIVFSLSLVLCNFLPSSVCGECCQSRLLPEMVGASCPVLTIF